MPRIAALLPLAVGASAVVCTIFLHALAVSAMKIATSQISAGTSGPGNTRSSARKTASTAVTSQNGRHDPPA